jgi:hypothetical protein
VETLVALAAGVCGNAVAQPMMQKTGRNAAMFGRMTIQGWSGARTKAASLLILVDTS